MVSSISKPDDKIATDFGSKSTTKIKIATRVISATDPHLTMTILISPSPFA